MSKKKSLTSEERVAAVQEYLDGKGGYKAIARKYNIGLEDVKSDSHFSINVGITTVYRREIELHKGFNLNMNWLMGLDSFEKYLNNSPIYNRSLGWFDYDKNRPDSLIESMQKAFEKSKIIVAPVFEKIHDLDNVIDYFCVFNPGFINFGAPEDWLSDNYVTEGLFCVKISDTNSIAVRNGRAVPLTAMEFEGMTYEGAINHALDQEVKSELDKSLADK
ncbi:transposase, partial [Ruminococcus sp.]|uniref:transposase n=1 Tax=Ruminococcus sp. TaxID=41978 RepID=UPI002C1454C7